MDRGTGNQPVAAAGLLRGKVDRVVMDALALLAAGPAAGAADGDVPPQPEDLRLHAAFLQGCGGLRQGGVGAALLMGAAVEQQYLHCAILLLFQKFSSQYSRFPQKRNAGRPVFFQNIA